MNPFFAYLIKSTVSLALFYIVFKLTVSNDKMHSVNRFVLLGIVIVSTIIPFADIPVLQESPVIPRVEVFREFVVAPVFSSAPVFENVQPAPETKSVHLNLYLIFYLFIITALFIRLIISTIRVLQIINRAEKQPFQKIVLAVVKDFIQPFTFLKHIIISEKDFTENKEIIVAHEYAHIKHLHAIDLLICDLFTALYWFNPFMWFLRRDLKLIHEFQADQAVLNYGIDAKKYQLLVLQKSVGERRFAMANHFRQKPILKRLKMMQKKKKNRWKGVKLILFIPMILLLLQAFARPEIFVEKASEFVPVIQQNKTEKWLQKWTVENIGKGFYQPGMKSEDSPKISNNILVILMNRNNDFLVENIRVEKGDIKRIVKDFLQGIAPSEKSVPDFVEKDIPFVGKMKVNKGAISFRHDLASSEETINYTLNTIGEAWLEVKKEKAQILFGKEYFDLDEEKQEAVDMAAPVWFSYEYPAPPSPSVWLPFDNKPSPLPTPLNITIKNSGEIYVENYKFDSFEAFHENIVEWNKELIKINEGKRSKGFYRASLTFEDVSRVEYDKVALALYRNNIHVGQINSTSSKRQILPLQEDKLKAKILKNEARVNSDIIEMDCELSIPKGFSPNNDGVHDFFQILCIYPRYPDAKLMIFNHQGLKLFEKENYGNYDVWGRDDAWWKGTSENRVTADKGGRLSAGMYLYTLYLGNGEVENGTVMISY